jgi:hypothetical protein
MIAKPCTRNIAMILAAILITACAPKSKATSGSPTLISTAAVSGTPTSPPASSPTPPPSQAAATAPARQPASGETPIRVIFGNTVLTGRLWDNAPAHDLIAQLPLTLTFSDFNALEKIANLPLKLSLEGVPAGDDPLPNEIGYYAPWGNLVFYYGDVGYFNGIVRLGQFDGNLDAIVNQVGEFTVRIELAE